ncbi:MAG: MFS transporter [Planctomycetaceae bacterium]|nr:MFS transporter [Planctomycetaceae bacterium]
MTVPSTEQQSPDSRHGSRGSVIRYQVVAVSILMAFSLYLDRVCLGEIVKSASFTRDVPLSKEDIGSLLGSFFFTYALFQVPAGWISDRFGARRMLTGYILAWSILTGVTGLMTGFAGLLLARLGCGIAQAGAYPTSSAVIRRWVRLDRRGFASSLVSFGGRLGGTLAPVLTALAITWLGGWRPTMWLYGAVGLLVAFLYWRTVRDRPSEHPGCSEDEKAHIGRPVDDHRPEVRDVAATLLLYCQSRSLWLNSVGQFCINIGWAFLITWLPTYLKEKHGMEGANGAWMVTIVLAMGMLGQLIGGWATDFSVRHLGLRFGRILPISVACTIAGLAYLGCTVFTGVWAIVACCGIVSLMTDLGNPSIWGFMQDVGGRNTATVFGWANMWGNLGASVSSIMVPKLLAYGSADGSGQQLVFYACATSFFIAGAAALGMDATRPLTSSAAR